MRNSELDSELLSQVRELFQSVENQIKAATGYGFDALTESEARYLAKHDNAQSIRDRIIAAGSTASLRGNAGNASYSKGEKGVAGLPTTQVKSKGQSDAILINRKMANNFADAWNNAYEQVDLPDTLSEYAAAASAAFDASIVAI